MTSNEKFRAECQGVRQRESAANGYGVSFRGDQHVLKLCCGYGYPNIQNCH